MSVRIQPLMIPAAIGLALAGATAIQARGASGAAAPASEGRTVATAHGVAAEGRVVTYPGAEVKVAAERSGRLVRVLFQEGDRVSKGQVLAEIDGAELRAALDEARARVTETSAEVQLAEREDARRAALVREGVLSARDADAAARDLEVMRARRQTALAAVDRLSAQLDKSVVRAPIAGTAIARGFDAGETVEPGSAVATLANLDRLRVEGEADEADAAALRVGGPVLVRSDAYPGRTWRGAIEEVSDSVTVRRLRPQDPGRPTDTRVLGLKVRFAEPAPLKLGTTVELKVLTGDRASD